MVKTKGKKIKKINILPYFKEDSDNFSVFLKNQDKAIKKRRIPRKNISDEVIPAYAFRKTYNKPRNVSKEMLHKGSM